MILTSGLRRPLAVVATTAALILGTSAAAQAFTLADCYSGRGCTWSNNDYDGLTMTRHENAVSFGLVTNDTANSAASYGNTNCARFWEHGDYSGRYLDFQRPAIGGTYRDPNLANGGGSGGYTSDNWENIISSMNWRSC